MLRKRFIQACCFIGLISISIKGFAHDTDGFFVIPTAKVITKEICNGTSVGDVVFFISAGGQIVNTGSVWQDSDGQPIQIVGGTATVSRNTAVSFRRSTSTLPSPNGGVKGPFFATSLGDILYARYL